MKDQEVWEFISSNYKNGVSVMLLLVLDSQGSSPGRQGFKMAVTESDMAGSIGGGIMEHKFVELAKEKLAKQSNENLLRKQIHNKTVKQDQSGMICSGEQSICLHLITGDDAVAIDRLILSLTENKNGTLSITPDALLFSEGIPPLNYQFIQKSETDFSYIEKIGYQNHLYIIGGGHCSLALSKIMAMMDFYITLIDDRPQLNTFLANDVVHEKKSVSDYSLLSPLVPSGKSTYVVIMTFGYRTDNLSLRMLIDNDYKYLGVLGSKNKMKQLMEEWKQDELPEEKLAMLHTPVGLPINSQTPEEIAISIAAEIIRKKNKQ